MDYEAINVLVATCNAILVLALGYGAIRSPHLAQRWIGLFFLLGYVENILAIPVAFLGYNEYEYLLNFPETLLFHSLVMTSIISFWTAIWLLSKYRVENLWIFSYQDIKLPTADVKTIMLIFSFITVVAVTILSIGGFFGHFNVIDTGVQSPWWIDVVKILIQIGQSLLFLLIFFDFREYGRPGKRVWILIALWSISGFLTGFKSHVFGPLLLVVMLAILFGRVRLIYVAGLVAMISLSYEVVEVMRQVKGSYYDVSAIEAYRGYLSRVPNAEQEEQSILEQFFRRVDYSAVAINTFALDSMGGVSDYRARLEESYRLLIPMAIVPRALWPEKPLQDLGAVLNYELYAFEGNSITPGHVASSYLWFGIVGVIFNSAMGAFIIGICGRLVQWTSSSVLEKFPIFVFAVLCSPIYGLFFVRYIEVIRFTILLWLVYLALNVLGLTKKVNKLNSAGSITLKKYINLK